MNIGYARVSTYDQNLDLQLDALRRAGCDLIREEKVSGKSKERPVQEAVIRELKPGDTLTVYKLDRLGRSAMNLEEIVKELADHGVNFVATTQNIDTSNPQGWFFFQMLAAFAELEHAMIVERTIAGKAARAARGEHPGGPRNYGFEEDRTTVMEEEATRINEAAQYVLAGGSVAHLVDAWNAEGVPTKTGIGNWTETTLRRILLLPMYVPAILDRETHDALVRHFAPAEARQRLGRPAIHLLSGILHCECGTPMQVARSRVRADARQKSYRCPVGQGGRAAGCGRVWIQENTADRLVTEAIVAAVTGADDTGRSRFTDALNARRAALLEGEATTEELDAWGAEIADLQTVLGTRFGTEEHQRRHDELQERVKHAERRLLARPELQELLDLPRSEAAFREAWDHWTVPERRKRIRLLLRKVTVRAVGRGGRSSESRLVPDWKI